MDKTKYQIIRRIEENPFSGPQRWAVMRCSNDGLPEAMVSVHGSEVAAKQALQRLVDPNSDLPDPNPELYRVTHEIKWV